MSYAPMTNTYMAPAPQYYTTQPAVYSTSQMPMPAPVTQQMPVTYTQPAPMMTRAVEMAPVTPAPIDDAPPGYRLAGYAPAPDAGNLPEGWEFVNGKWIYVGKPEPTPVMMAPATQYPVATNYTSVAMPQPVTYTQPQVFATQQMPVTYGSAAPIAQYY